MTSSDSYTISSVMRVSIQTVGSEEAQVEGIRFKADSKVSTLETGPFISRRQVAQVLRLMRKSCLMPFSVADVDAVPVGREEELIFRRTYNCHSKKLSLVHQKICI
jgi:hypothetical protein